MRLVRLMSEGGTARHSMCDLAGEEVAAEVEVAELDEADDRDREGGSEVVVVEVEGAPTSFQRLAI